MDTEVRQVTVEEVLIETHRMLGRIFVPVELKNISDEIDRARFNIGLCIDTLKEERQKQELQAAATENAQEVDVEVEEIQAVKTPDEEKQTAE